ncbi:MAG: nucleotide kinase, partial [Methanomassiliicoccales archaeon]|nr:nucleotide kinase [Methanomassiliicoccales archaeon]
MNRGMKIGITGLPGAGKTHALLKVIEMLEAEELKVGGMITQPIIEDKKRTGF